MKKIKVDVLVNNAEYVLAGPLGGTSIEEEIRLI
jgi:short-subunit dehydrogenase